MEGRTQMNENVNLFLEEWKTGRGWKLVNMPEKAET